MSAPSQGIVAAIPWYRSPVVIAQVTSIVTGIAAVAPKASLVANLGLTDPVTVNADVSLVFATIAGLFQVAALVARVRSSVQPVTLTQTGADLHANTLTVQAAQTAQDKQAAELAQAKSDNPR